MNLRQSRAAGAAVLALTFQSGIFASFAKAQTAPAPQSAEHADVIDFGNKHQVMENFGASDAWTMQGVGGWSEENKNKIADLLFSTDHGIGLSLWRFNVGGGINHDSIRDPSRTAETFEVAEGKYDWSRQGNELWFSYAAKKRGVPYLLGFVNSPPARMTRNGLTNLGTDKQSTTNLKSGFQRQYATYLCDIVQHFRDQPSDQQLIFNYLSPVNEPQLDWEASKQEGCRASNDDIKSVVSALHEEITARKLDVKVRGIESCLVTDLWNLDADAMRKWNAPYGDYINVFLKDPVMSPMLDHTLCYHDYSSWSGPSVERDHRILGEKIAAVPDAKLWMSEICLLSSRRDLTIRSALDVAKLMHADIALAGASAWHWWLAMSYSNYKDGLLFTNWRKPGDPESILVSKTLWAMGNFSRFVRPGMQRIELTGDHHSFDQLLGSAYFDSKSNRLVMVYINLSNTPQKVTWTFKNGDLSGQLIPYLTSASDDLAEKPPISATSGAEIPPQCVETFVSAAPAL